MYSSSLLNENYPQHLALLVVVTYMMFLVSSVRLMGCSYDVFSALHHTIATDTELPISYLLYGMLFCCEIDSVLTISNPNTPRLNDGERT